MTISRIRGRETFVSGEESLQAVVREEDLTLVIEGMHDRAAIRLSASEAQSLRRFIDKHFAAPAR
ncbi:MAG: hypothetical protein AAF355_08870 [Myxococcota bacterium]